MTRIAVSVAALVLATALPACAADPVLESAATVQKIVPGYEEVWRDGQQDEAKGLKALAKADAAVAEERARVLEGERMIAEGSAGVEAQRSAYKKFSSRTGAATSAKEAKIEADSLTSIVKPNSERMNSALPDFQGDIWFVVKQSGKVGIIDRGVMNVNAEVADVMRQVSAQSRAGHDATQDIINNYPTGGSGKRDHFDDQGNFKGNW